MLNLAEPSKMLSAWWTRPFLWSFLLLFVKRSTQQSQSSNAVSISIKGDPVSVWSSVDTWKKCHLIDVPDIPARAFVAESGISSNNLMIRMNVGAVGYHEMHGPTLFNQTRSCAIAWNASMDPDPSMFAANEFIDSTVRFDNGTVVALVHTEFPGNRYNTCDISSSDSIPDFRKHGAYHGRRLGIKKPLTYPTCWTVTIGLVVSHDFGKTWDYAAKPPHHLVAAVPYKYNQSQLAYGWGDPSDIVQFCSTKEDCFFYVAMFNRNQVGAQPAGICMARTKHLLDPTSWRGWNGTDFSVKFANPYVAADNFDPRNHVCETIIPPGLPDPGGCTMLGLVWSDYLHTFVATIGCLVGHASGKIFHWTTSKDLIHWTPVTELYNRDKDLPPAVRSQTTAIQYPSLMDPTNGDPNFSRIGKNPYLFWASLGHSPYSDGRHLWATPIQFDIHEEEEDAIMGTKDIV